MNVPRQTVDESTATSRDALHRDRELLLAWQGGNRDAGIHLLDHYAAFVRQVARRAGVRGEEDFVEFWQELLLRLLQHLPLLHERVHRSFAGYLAWQVRDLASRFRARRRAATSDPEPLVDAGAGDAVERAEFWRVVANCEATLPDGERTVFAMRFREGLSLGEVAARTFSNANAVAQAVFRLVRRMRACLARRGFGFGGGEEDPS